MRYLLLLGLVACQVGTTSRDEFQREYPYGSTLALSPTMLASAIGAVERNGNQIRITELTAHDEYITIVAQDPKALMHLDSYEWRAGTLGTPSPVQVNNPDQISATLFPLAEVPLDLLPYAITANEQAKIEDGHVEKVSMQRMIGGGEFLTISINGPRKSTNVRIDLQSH